MARGIWELFLSVFRRSEADEEGEEAGSRFVPSPLDLSVRVAHGGPDDQVERELSRLEERAREMEAGERGE